MCDNAAMDDFGSHAPSGRNRLIRFLVAIGLGHGKLKRVFFRHWSAPSPDVDVRYHGLRLRLRPRGNAIESKLLVTSRLCEGKELAFMARHLAGGGNFVDLGANVGYYSLMAVKMGASRALGLEPNPEMMGRFKTNIALNGFEAAITALPFAAGDSDGAATLNLMADTGSSSIVSDAAAVGSLEVRVRPLAALLAEQDITAVRAMKVDIEGMEDLALRPFLVAENRRLFPRLLIIEHLNRDRWQGDILALLLRNGYAVAAKTSNNSILELQS